MAVFDGIAAFQPPVAGVVLTIGNFDGVHRGHQAIVERARALAARYGLPVVAMTFEPHPLAVLAPAHAPPRLSTELEKVALLELAGVQDVIIVRPDRQFLAQSAEDFLADVCYRCRPRAIVEGQTFNFGRRRQGTITTLRDFAQRYGYEVHVVDTLVCDELPEAPPVDSSTIRRVLMAREVEAAALMLGRPYRIVGTVVHGDARGRQLGFPTANLAHVPHLLPGEAVYAAVAERASGALQLAAVNVGRQPTFGETRSRVEAHLLDFNSDLDSERLGLHFVARLRDQRRFSNASELVLQLEKDVAATRRHAAAVRRIQQAARLPLR